MVDFKYLYLGLCGMSRAHDANAMAGHLGAAVVAGYFVGEDLPDLDPKVYTAIEANLDRIIQGDEGIWYDAKKLGIRIPELFEPFPDEPSEQVDVAVIPKALGDNIRALRQTGHNVIFTSIAVRALREHSQYATEAIVAGIQKLIALFDHANPGRGYYGKSPGWILGNEVTLDEHTEFPPYQNQQDMVETVIDELIQTGSVHRQGFGGLFHVINHAAAITELARFGYQKLAQQGLAAHHHHVRLWRSLPDEEAELGPLKSAQHDPRTPEYWQEKDSHQWSAHLTHRIKTIYGFFTLLRFIESETKRQQSLEKFRYLMA